MNKLNFKINKYSYNVTPHNLAILYNAKLDKNSEKEAITYLINNQMMAGHFSWDEWQEVYIDLKYILDTSTSLEEAFDKTERFDDTKSAYLRQTINTIYNSGLAPNITARRKR